MTEKLSKLKGLYGKAANQGFNWTAVLVWGGLLGIGFFAVWFYKVEPFYGWGVGLAEWVGSTIASLTGGLNAENIVDQVTEYIKANPIVAFTGIIAVTGGVLALYERSQRIRETNLKLAAKEAEEYASLQKTAVTDDLAYYKTKADSYEAELASMKETNTAQLYETAKNELTSKTAEIESLKRQQQELMDKLANTPVKIVERVK